MIDTDGMITVAEAAKRLNRSIEQVRRYLREGKLKGRRVGNQWFVDPASINQSVPEAVYSARKLAFERALAVRERIREQYGEIDIDAEIEAGRNSREPDAGRVP
jgi:excisionase family DNA binding protein